ncbi:MAG: Xaa-Pro peptidase family protein [Ignavibacteriales bacterium]|nr:Xaa-Pro peptidase family protein [Ignavibacteriales bacterium]
MISRRSFLKVGGLSISAAGFASSLFANTSSSQEAKLQNMVSGVKPLTPEDYEERLEQARKLMAKTNMDALFVSGGSDLGYFTNVNWFLSERTFGGIINRKGKTIWVWPAFEAESAREMIPKEQELRTWEEHENPFQLIGGVMKDLGAASGRLGIAPATRSFVGFGLKKEVPGLELVNGAVISEGCRGIKSPKELAYMELANKITKLAYAEGFKQIKEGMSPRDLSGAISSAHQQMGVRGSGGPQFGLSTAFPHGSRAQRTLHDGDVVMVDGGCSVEGFQSDVTRTVVFGKPTDKQKAVWDIVKKAQSAALKAARPGVPCEEVDRAARKVIEDAGYGPGYKYFAHRLGHGIGMDGHEFPYLVKENKLKLQTGMTFSDEPGIYIYGEFGIRIEDCFVVTEDGGRFFGGMEATAIDKPFGEA